MKINEKRLLHDLRHLRGITATPGRGVTRLTYSREDQEARNYITSIAKAFHFNIRVDGIGNILIAPHCATARAEVFPCWRRRPVWILRRTFCR